MGGRYRVERLLGEGGMGAVYHVRDDATGQHLALKRLHARVNAKQAELFEREYQTLASLRHPRIVRVDEYGVDEQGAFYTMELLEGHDLASRAPMPWREVCGCLRDAAAILGVLHARRLVHRDLSPRNLWRTPDGRLKLLDFGALAPFGPAQELVGTAPFVPPEALAAKTLDGRSDLFALGALGYWLLTSTHAFRATHFGELTRLWQKPPAPPSSLAQLVPEADATIPVELDLLIGALLQIDPDARPRSTGEVINHLNAIAGLTPEAEDVAVRGYLDSNAFVGRERERDRFAKALARASQGNVQALQVEGVEGIGRTRLLHELAMAARLSGATVLSVEASTLARPYDTAVTIARALFKALPSAAVSAAREHVEVLGALSHDLSTLLSTTRVWRSSDPVEERSRRQRALARWILTLSEARTLVLIVDDLQRIDEESHALLAALARAENGHRLLLVGALCTEEGRAEPARAQSLSPAARALVLAPLSAVQIRELLRSVFGEVQYLDRLAAKLHELSDGVPSHALMLARTLVATGVIRYADGGWALPTDLPDDLPSSLRASVLAGLDTVSDQERLVLRFAGLSDLGPVSTLLLAKLTGLAEPEVERVVQGLLALRLVRTSEEGAHLAHPALGVALRAELDESEQRRAHRLLAQELSTVDDVLTQTRAGLHFLRAGAMREGEALLRAISRRMLAGARAYPRAMAAMFAEALTLLRAHGRDDYAQIPLLNALAVAGYQVDRSYAARYGDDALDALQRALCFSLARKLRPYLGGIVSLLVALALASARMRWRKAGMGALEAVAWLVTVTGYLMGPAAMSIDREKLQRYARVFEPLLALGKDHGVAVVHRFCLGLGLSIEDRCAEAQTLLGGVIQRLSDPRPISALPDGNRRNLFGAASYAYGMRETFACDPHLLETADKLAAGSPMHVMQADQLRGIYHSYLGDLSRANDYEQRVELQAVQLGTAWQAELLAPRQLARGAFWTHDLAALKRAERALTRLAQDIPSFQVSARRAQGMELVLRGKYREALPLLDVQGEEPLAELGWVCARGLLAAAYNGLGEHARAKAICEHALSLLRAEDRAFVVQNLIAEVELALAEARLSSPAVAHELLRALLTAHAGKGPLVLGYLHRARARVALLAKDHRAADEHLLQMEACYRPTRIASLLILCAELRHELRNARDARPRASQAQLTADDAHLLTRVELIMSSDRGDLDERSLAALQVALELTSADRAFLLFANDRGPKGWLGIPPSSAALAWASARLQSVMTDDCTELISEGGTVTDEDDQSFDGARHVLSLLWHREAGVEKPLAALVLGSEAAQPGPVPSAVLRLLAQRLGRTRLTERPPDNDTTLPNEHSA